MLTRLLWLRPGLGTWSFGTAARPATTNLPVWSDAAGNLHSAQSSIALQAMVKF
jgi:hypothetical protein